MTPERTMITLSPRTSAILFFALMCCFTIAWLDYPLVPTNAPTAYEAYCTAHADLPRLTTLAGNLLAIEYWWVLPSEGARGGIRQEVTRMEFGAYNARINALGFHLRGEYGSRISCWFPLPHRQPCPHGDVPLNGGVLHIFSVTTEKIEYAFTKTEDPKAVPVPKIARQ